MYILVIAALLGVVFLCYWWKRHPRSPPTLPGYLPIIGNTHHVIKYCNDVYSSYLEPMGEHVLENGGIFQTHLGLHTVYIVNDPETVGIISNTCLNKAFFYNFMIEGLGNGLVTLNGDTWKIHNKLLNPAFSQKVLNTFLDEMNVQAQHLVSQLTTVAAKAQVDITDLLIKYVLRLVCRTSLGLEAKDQDMIGNDFTNSIESVLKIIIRRILLPVLYPSFIYNCTALSSTQQELSKKVQKLINPIIQKRKSELTATKCKNNDDDAVPGKFKPALDLMLHLSDEQYILSDDEIRAHLNTFVAASYDTTSSAIHNILMALGSYPDVQEQVYNEVRDVFGNNETLTKYDMTKLVYLEAVIKEVLRIYSIIPLVARRIDTDIVLPKYTLRAGSTCILSLYGLHRHSSWGPDVREFKPERWLNPDTLPTQPNVYAPFGIGKRICPGKQYAMMSMKTSIAHIIRKFHISCDINIVNWYYEIVLKAKTPRIQLTLRS